MYKPLDRAALERQVWQARDTAAPLDQEEEVRQIALVCSRVYLSKARLRAEVYLQQN